MNRQVGVPIDEHSLQIQHLDGQVMDGGVCSFNCSACRGYLRMLAPCVERDDVLAAAQERYSGKHS